MGTFFDYQAQLVIQLYVERQLLSLPLLLAKLNPIHETSQFSFCSVTLSDELQNRTR